MIDNVPKQKKGATLKCAKHRFEIPHARNATKSATGNTQAHYKRPKLPSSKTRRPCEQTSGVTFAAVGWPLPRCNGTQRIRMFAYRDTSSAWSCLVTVVSALGRTVRGEDRSRTSAGIRWKSASVLMALKASPVEEKVLSSTPVIRAPNAAFKATLLKLGMWLNTVAKLTHREGRLDVRGLHVVQNHRLRARDGVRGACGVRLPLRPAP